MKQDLINKFIAPRYTTQERDALDATAGLIIWNSTLSKLQVYDGSSWVSLN